MGVILYSTGCPKCNILKKKLYDFGIDYELFTDVSAMIEMGIQSVPVLSVNGQLMDFATANKWINNYAEGCDKCK